MCAYMLSYVYSVLRIKIGSIFECIYGNHPEVYCFPYLIIIIIIIGHNSASRTTDEAEVDAHVHEALRMEDPDILLDLRHTNWK